MGLFVGIFVDFLNCQKLLLFFDSPDATPPQHYGLWKMEDLAGFESRHKFRAFETQLHDSHVSKHNELCLLFIFDLLYTQSCNTASTLLQLHLMLFRVLSIINSWKVSYVKQKINFVKNLKVLNGIIPNMNPLYAAAFNLKNLAQFCTYSVQYTVNSEHSRKFST